MFTTETFDFLIENRLHNSREWFEEHRDVYRRAVLEPLTALCCELGDTMTLIDEKIVTAPKINRAISRIFRDSRFSRDKSIFRETMWLTFKRDKKEYLRYPEFYVVIDPQGLLYGCGYYKMLPESMRAARELILNGDPSFRRALSAYSSQQLFLIEGDMLARSKYECADEKIAQWLCRKELSFSRRETDASLVFSPSLGRVLSERLMLLAPEYEFFLKAERLSREKYRVK